MHVPHQNGLSFLRILIPYALGISFFYGFKPVPGILLLTSLNLLLFIGLAFINFRYKEIKAYRFKVFTGSILQLLLFFFGGLSCISYTQSLKSDHFSKTSSSYLKIRIIEEPQYKNGICRFKAQVMLSYQISADSGQQGVYLLPKPASGAIMVAIKTPVKTILTLYYGEVLIIPSLFSEVSPPHLSSEFDYKAWLATQNINHQTFLYPQQYLKIKGNKGNPILTFALRLRQQQLKRYAKLIKNKEAIALASTLILGYRTDLSKDTLDVYAKTGTIHALSVSGMHVGLIYMVLNHLLSFLNSGKRGKLIKLILILPAIWFYALLTGFSPSVLRSVLMLSVFLIAKSWSRPANSYNIVAFSAFCILVYQPFLLWDVGFQLSFLAVSGLVYLQPKIQQSWPIENKWLYKLWGVIAMSLAAQVFTFPSSVYYFHQFPLYFLLSNVFILIPIALLMYLGIIILFPGFDFLASLFEWLIHFTNQGLRWISQLPFSSLSGIWISKIEFILLCLALIFLVIAIVHHQKKAFFISLTVLILLQGFLSHDQIRTYHQRKIITFKIPKQQAIAYIFSNRATVYTTLTKQDKAFIYFIRPALDQYQVKSIKLVPP
ncbi:ComEC/Rec2 family competence protein [Pedobacter caeni]|uniref:Competence protein ComEC n=1 Tax=Pedobacter caeni TaxID=288992 RepID=A0A1M5J3L8_9SPHI|nr:ComEC/Rec2 family competence protein [Pedobacter caeni]SHG35197.1 competence protein ComEC [Pedobacter caeni]